MIRIRGRSAVYGEVWYDEELPRDPGVDIVLYRQRETPIGDARTAPFLTLARAGGESSVPRTYLRSTIPSFGLKVTWVTAAPSLTAGSWDPARRRSPGSTLTVLSTIVGLTSTTPF